MNDDINEIKSRVPTELVAEHYGAVYVKTDRHGCLWYKDMFQGENTASFKVDPRTNRWHDFRRQEGVNADGSNIDLHIDANNGNRTDPKDIAKAVEFLKQFTYIAPRNESVSKIRKEYSDRYRILKTSEKIWHPALKSHIEWRGLDLMHFEHIKQVHIQDTVNGKKVNGFALENNEGGMEVSIPNPATNFTFKTCIGPKGPTIIEPTKAGGNKWVVFEGMWDMQTWIQMTPNWQEFWISCLNSVNQAERLIEYVPSVDQMYLFMDNDKAGEDAENLLCDAFPVAGSMRYLYEGYGDLSKKWQDQPKQEMAQGHRVTNAPRLKL